MTSEIDNIRRRKWADSIYSDAFNRYDLHEEHPLSPDLPHTPARSKVLGIQRAICAALLTFGISTQVLEVGKPSSHQEPPTPISQEFNPNPSNNLEFLPSTILQVPENFEGLVEPNSEQLKIIQKLAAGPQASEPVAAEVSPGEVSAHTLLMPLVTSVEVEAEKPPIEKLRESLYGLGITVTTIYNNVEPTDPRSMLEGTIFFSRPICDWLCRSKVDCTKIGY